MQETIQEWGNVKNKKEFTLEDIFKDYDGEYVAEEFDWGSPVEKEVW